MDSPGDCVIDAADPDQDAAAMAAGRKVFVGLLQDACRGTEMSVRPLTDDGWIQVAERAGETRLVIGYVFDTASSSVAEIVHDKCALATFLADQGIAHVPHLLAMRRLEGAGGWADPDESGEAAAEVLDRLPVRAPVVLKPVRGTAGRGVQRATTEEEARDLLSAMFRRNRRVAVSPYVEISREVRVVVVDGTVACALDKLRGDDWRHNLARGAQAVDLPEAPQGAAVLAVRAAEVLRMGVAVVDVVEVDGEWFVLEVNRGTKLVDWAQQSDLARERAVAVYRRVLDSMFEPATEPVVQAVS